MIRSAIGVVVGLGASALPAVGQHALRYTIEPGLAYRFEQTVSMRMDVGLESQWQSMEIEQRSEQVTRGSVEVVEVEAGATIVARVTFDGDSGSVITTSMAPQPQNVPFELAGQTVVASLLPDGSIAISRENGAAFPSLLPDTTQLVRSIAIPDPAFPPTEAIDVGESWSAVLGSPSDPIRPEYTFTLSDVDDTSANVRTAAQVESEAEGIRFEADLTGGLVVDLETGLPVSSTLSGPVTSGGETDMGNGMTATISGTGTVTQTTTITIGGTKPVTTTASTPADASPETPRDGWTTYSHAPSGLSFDHPSDWQMQDSPQGIQIVPADADPQRELLFGFGAPALGETDAASPAAQQNLDMVLRAQAPMLVRRGAPERIEVAEGSAAIYRYAGPMPDGSPGACTVFVRILGDTAVAMGIAGTEAKVAERSPVLRSMFDSLAGTEPRTQSAGQVGGPGGGADTDDRRLIGMFRGEAISSNVEGIYINTQLVYAIGADGRLHYGAKSAIAASKRDYNQDLRWTLTGESAGDVRSGDWSAKNGFVTVNWDDGARSVFAYGFEPDGSLVLRNPQTRELINFFPRVR